MPPSLRRLIAAKRSEHSSSGKRFVDLRVDVVEEDDKGARTGKTLVSVGGRWDRLQRRYRGPVKDARKRMVLTAHPGQLAFWSWFVAWLRAKVAGSRLTTEVVRADGSASQRKVWTVLSHGGRRGGKTDSAVKAAVVYALLFPRSIVWLVSESMPKTEEMNRDLDALLPRSWCRPLGAPHFVRRIPNGSAIFLRSAHDPDDLKQGRTDFAVINEGSETSERAYHNVRAAISDVGGLVIITANPPEKPIGQWVFNMYEKAHARRIAVKEFFFDPVKNPHIQVEALEDMADEVDRRTFNIEVRGIFLPRSDVVLYEYAPADHERTPGVLDGVALEDVSPTFLRRHFGREFDVAIGLDFQSTPHMPAGIFRFYRDPADPGGDPLAWLVDEIVIENAVEEDMVSALHAHGFDPARTVLIGDASADWQNVERTKGRGSFDMIRAGGFPFIYPPDPATNRNPDRLDRFKVANARLRDATGKIHFYTSPENTWSNSGMRNLEQKNGVPNARSEYAHCVDAVTYVLFRLWPRRMSSRSRSALGSRSPRHRRDREREEVF